MLFKSRAAASLLALSLLSPTTVLALPVEADNGVSEAFVSTTLSTTTEEPIIGTSKTQETEDEEDFVMINKEDVEEEDAESDDLELRDLDTRATARKNMAYFTNWSTYNGYDVKNLPLFFLTHIIYAFCEITSNGTVISSDEQADILKRYPNDKDADGNNVYGAVRQLYLLKKRNRSLKTLLSIGGYTASQAGAFNPAINNAAGRTRFANSAVKLMADWGFDGIDIDYEYPTTSTQAKNFTALLKAVRAALDAYAAANTPGYHYLLTVATPAGAQNYETLDIAGMNQYIDTWHLMAYDYSGSWASTASHHANVYMATKNKAATITSSELALAGYTSAGVKASKIVLGLPLYGRSFEKTTGLGKSYNGVGPGYSEAGVWPYNQLPKSGATVKYNPDVLGTTSYDSKTKELISYDDVDSVKGKAGYIADTGLAGAFFWDASGDKSVAADSLIKNMFNTLGTTETTQNQLNYPASVYDNMRNGM